LADSSSSAPVVEGRLANVSAVLMSGADEGRTRELGLCLESLFDDVSVVESLAADAAPGEAAVRELVSALVPAREEFVLVVAADAPRPAPNLWLALTAWPQHDVVAPRCSPDVPPSCSLYRRDAAMEVVRQRLSAPDKGETRTTALQQVIAALEADFIEGTDLSALEELGA